MTNTIAAAWRSDYPGDNNDLLYFFRAICIACSIDMGLRKAKLCLIPIRFADKTKDALLIYTTFSNSFFLRIQSHHHKMDC